MKYLSENNYTLLHFLDNSVNQMVVNRDVDGINHALKCSEEQYELMRVHCEYDIMMHKVTNISKKIDLIDDVSQKIIILNDIIHEFKEIQLFIESNSIHNKFYYEKSSILKGIEATEMKKNELINQFHN